jgi:5-methylcytosine-specific restriction endonuclease McrA
VLDRDPVCRVCCNAESTEVDHVNAGDDHSLLNLQGICQPCHGRKSAQEGQAASR